MGWTIIIQVVRDRPLTPAERKTLTAHARRFKLSRKGCTYRFQVAPEGSPGGVIATAGGKLARSADPDEDDDVATLYRALTELRSLFSGATLEVADDLHLVGWDEDRYTLTRNPDQELTKEPEDQSAWIAVPPQRAPRQPKPAATTEGRQKKSTLPAAIEEALTVLAARGEPVIPAYSDDDVRTLLPLLFDARAKATRDDDSRRYTDLGHVIARLPAGLVIDVGLDSRHYGGAAGDPVAAAVQRLDDVSPLRDRLLGMWFGREPDKGAPEVWNSLAYAMQSAVHDPAVIERLGTSLIEASLDDRTYGHRHLKTMDLLMRAPTGIGWLVRKRRTERTDKPRFYTAALLRHLIDAGSPLVVATLLFELAHRNADRDDLIAALARQDDPRVMPALERILATDQYTRPVASALLDRVEPRAEELLGALVEHADPVVRIRAAQGLVFRRGVAELPRLDRAVDEARAAGAWHQEYGVGAWGSEQLRSPDDARYRPPWRLKHFTWPTESKRDDAFAQPPTATAEPMAAWSRMRSPNPDIRRDAIESAHAAALAARDATRILALVAAERLHAASCRRDDVPQTVNSGSCTRVNVTNYWSSWKKLAKLPFDPMYKYDHVTWNYLAAHAAEIAPQIIPPELADLTDAAAIDALVAAQPSRRVAFPAKDVAAWDAEEAELATGG